MQYRNILLTLALFTGISVNAQTESAEDSLGLPGDNFDLYGALDLFKSASSLEDFEKKLNEENNQVNNLDLNEDGDVDYIMVVDNMDGDAHAIQLQVAISETETQDVAAIEIEKTGAESADLQLVGDEELYGADYIVEATDEKASGSTDQKWQNFRSSVVVVNVWIWPSVRFIYAPAYVVWRSPYRWHYYPVWWKPWRPVAWRVHHARVVRYHHPYYHCVHAHRVARAHVVYHAHRRSSPAVHRRHEAAHQRRAAAHSGGKVSGPRENSTGQSTGKQAGGKKGGANASGKKAGGNGGAAKKGGGAGPKKGGGGGKRR